MDAQLNHRDITTDHDIDSFRVGALDPLIFRGQPSGEQSDPAGKNGETNATCHSDTVSVICVVVRGITLVNFLDLSKVQIGFLFRPSLPSRVVGGGRGFPGERGIERRRRPLIGN